MSRITDLTIPLASGIGHPMFRKVQVAPYQLPKIHRRSSADLSPDIHTATHVDAPYRFFASGTTNDRLSVDLLFGEGVLFWVEGGAQAGHRIIVADPKAGPKRNGADLKGKIAVAAKGWSNCAFSGEPRYFQDSPTLSPDAAKWLAETEVKGIVLDSATDAANPASVEERACPVHRTFVSHSIPLIENYIHLGKSLKAIGSPSTPFL